MYFPIIILLFVILLCLLLGLWHRHIAVKKVCSLSRKDKCELLNTILSPFGYVYDSKHDIISTLNDAWQRRAGYTALFDHAALSLSMVIDALPVYFDYRGRTWLIEFWKGQYGINTGAEIGIYCADRILEEHELKKAHFDAVKDFERIPMTFTLYRDSEPIAAVSRPAWWLTSFCVGMFSSPSRLAMDCILQFPDSEIQACFIAALRQTAPDISHHCNGLNVHLVYGTDCPVYGGCSGKTSWLRRLLICPVQLGNRLGCCLYRFITGRFDCTLDKILYLYYLLPVILRRMLWRLKGVIHS